MIETGRHGKIESVSEALTIQFFSGALDVQRFKIFAERSFRLQNGIRLNVVVIGKSHAVQIERGGHLFSELVACVPDEELGADAIARRVKLVALAGKDSVRISQPFGRLRVAYHRLPLTATLVSQWYARAASGSAVSHRFPSDHGDAITVVNVSERDAAYDTIHTYPESGSAIITRTELF